MFIERSSARIRLVRTLFVLLGVIPCAGLGGWATLRQSAGHRQAIERRCGQVLGLGVRIERVEHLRPDAVRLWGVVVAAPAGAAVLSLPSVDLESSSTEVRVRLGRVACTPRLARTLADVAEQWLRQPARFPFDCVVDVGEVSWSTSDARPGGEAQGGAVVVAGLRVECVAAEGSRAVRVVRRDAGGRGDAIDEVRVLASAAAEAGGGGSAADVRLEVTGSLATPVPVGVLESCCDAEAGSFACGKSAAFSGRFDSWYEGGRWSGTAQGRVERIDLAEASAHRPYRLSGDAALAIERIEWARGRITAVDGTFQASRGTVEQRLLEGLVNAIGCRPGPAYRSPLGEQVRAFDEAAGRLRIGPYGVDLRAAPGRAAALANVRGTALLEEPPAAVPVSRIAWLMSPAGSVAVPASPATGWLLDLFPESFVEGESSQNRGSSEQAVRPSRRSDF